jgi:formamidopyrimidine-DNA glycosylase
VVPELPEIEALRETIETRLVGVRPSRISVRQFNLVKTVDPPLDDLVDTEVAGARRHGKHLLIDFALDLTLAVHLGIGGRLLLEDAARKHPRNLSLDIELDDGRGLRVVELGTKKRSSVHLLRASNVPEHLAHLGIDALSPELTVEGLAGLLAKDRLQLKLFLEDQRRVAGIGNAYSDEILWEAKLAPLRLTPTLEPEDVARLHAAIGTVIERALEYARADNYLLVARGDERGTFLVHRREGQPCRRCGERIASIHYAENSLQYCPACQVEGRQYADRRLSRLLR